MIKLENVTKFYNSNGIITHALKNINLELYKNEFVAICGPSGSGKSTLLNVICKQDTFDEGEMYYKGNETAYFNVDDMDDFRKNKVGFIFQNYNIIESYTVLQNVMLPYELKGIDFKEAKRKALAIISKVGLMDKINNRGAQLSGGQKQRCVIARALAFEPEILACDEPTGNLDSKTGAEIMALIHEIAKDKLVLVVTHNYEEVEPYATRKITLVDGTIYEDKKLKAVELKEEKENLNLDYVPLPKKVNLRVSLRNLINTPKKTIFSSLVIFFSCFFMLSLYQVIDYIYNVDVETSSGFHYKDKNKYVICAKNKEISYDDLDEITKGNTYIINPIIEKKLSYCPVYDGQDKCGEINAYFDTGFTNYNPNYGRAPENDNELYLLVSDYASLRNYKDMVGKYIETRYKKCLLVGIECAYCVNDSVLIAPYNLYKKINDFSFSYSVLANDKALSSTFYVCPSESGKNILHVSDDYKNKNIDYKIIGHSNSKVNKLIEDFSVEYFSGFGDPYLELESAKDEKIIQISVYNAKKDIVETSQKLNYIIFNTKTYDSYSPIEKIEKNLEAYGMMFLSSLVIIIVYFISFSLIKNIYKTKAYDFNIFRTLGVTKRDMRYITMLELLIQTLFISIFTYVLILILGLFAKAGSPLIIYRGINFTTSILYFVVILLFGYLIARRFNKKLFKFSVAKTFKEAHND